MVQVTYSAWEMLEADVHERELPGHGVHTYWTSMSARVHAVPMGKPSEDILALCVYRPEWKLTPSWGHWTDEHPAEGFLRCADCRGLYPLDPD